MDNLTPEQSERIDAFWSACRAAYGIAGEHAHIGPFSVPRHAPYQDMLLDLVRSGAKRATARLDMEFERWSIPRRAPGDHWVVLSAEGEPRFLIRVTDTAVIPFDEVPESFAAREGEGDGSLAYWREVHRDYFVLLCREWGVEWRENLPVFCEGFELVAAAD